MLVFLGACDKASDEAVIKQQIEEIQQAVEEKNFSVVGEFLHKDFLANGSMDAQQLRQLLLMVGRQHNHITITVLGNETVIDPVYTSKAETQLSVVMTGGSGRLPSDASVRMVSLEWLKENDDWRIYRAYWQR